LALLPFLLLTVFLYLTGRQSSHSRA